MADPAEKKKLRQLKEELANRERLLEQEHGKVQKRLQRSIQGIEMFLIGANAGHRAFHKLMIRRHNRISNICSTKVAGAPVLPPLLPPKQAAPEKQRTYHIVKIIGKLGRQVLLLFQENDMYLIGFKPFHQDNNINDATPWFRFEGEPFPSFLNSIEIAYKSSYTNIDDIEIGYNCLDDICEVLSKYNVENAMQRTNERRKVLRGACFMLSEAQRLGEVQVLIKELLSTRRRICIPHLVKKIRSWRLLSSHTLQHVCGNDTALKEVEYLVPGLYNPQKKTYEMWKLVGRKKEQESEECRFGRRIGKELLILCFEPHYAIGAIMKQEAAAGKVKPKHLKEKSKHRVLKDSCAPVPPLPLKDKASAEQFLISAEVKPKHLKEKSSHIVLKDSCAPVPPLPMKDKASAEIVLIPEERLNQKVHGTTGHAQIIPKDTLKHSQPSASCDDAPPAPPSDKVVVRHGGISLYESDLDTLRGPWWLTDAVIGFTFAKLSSSITNIEDVLLLPPSITGMMNAGSPYVAQLENSLRLRSRSLVLMVVTDSEDASIADSGSHWSLLVLDNTRNRFVHHDSMGVANLKVAEHLSNMIREGLPDVQDAQLINAATPQQRNCHDCGIYVMAVAEVICRWWSRNSAGVHATDWVDMVLRECKDPDKVEGMRTKLLRQIESYKTKDKSNHRAVGSASLG